MRRFEVLEAVARPGRGNRHELGQRERGWREVGRKEVRKVEEMRVWSEGEEVRRSWREGCGEGFDWWVGCGGKSIEFSEREEWRREECWIERLSLALSL
jgi:hypothetical protein